MTNYEIALEVFRKESAEYRASCEAYRAGKINDNQYLSARAKFNEANAALDNAEAIEIKE